MCEPDEIEAEVPRCRTCSLPLSDDELDSDRPHIDCAACQVAAEMRFNHLAHGWCGRSDRHHGGFDPGFSDQQYEGE